MKLYPNNLKIATIFLPLKKIYVNLCKIALHGYVR